MDIADRVCDLECTKPKKEPRVPKHEFVGPVKIVLVEATPDEYRRRVWGSALISFAMILLGTTVFTVFFFTLKFKLPFTMNVHVFLCTMGYQLFMTSGIMMFSTLFGGAVHLKPAHRKLQHFLLQFFAALTGISGSYLAMMEKWQFTIHALTGLAGGGLLVLASLLGPTLCLSNTDKAYGQFNKMLHVFFAVPSFMLCTVSFIQGLLKESFINWIPIKHLHIILIFFTLLYSMIALAAVYWRLKYCI